MENLEKYLPAVKKIFRQNKVVFALLFGSVAFGKEGRLSDVDFAVFLKKGVDYFNSRLRLLDQLGKIIKSLPIDVVVLNESSPILAQMVLEKGKIIFCQDEEARVGFYSEVFRKFEEARFLRGQFYNYLEQRVFENKMGEKLYG